MPRNQLVVPIIEYLPLDSVPSARDANEEMFAEEYEGKHHRYYAGVKEALQRSYGIYIFYDSRGRALYAGKAVDQSLWKEMNAAYNRNRGDLQTIRTVSHPLDRGKFALESNNRGIREHRVPLWELSSYVSAYAIQPTAMISMFEALIVRAFANDLLNKRMERLRTPAAKATKRRRG